MKARLQNERDRVLSRDAEREASEDPAEDRMIEFQRTMDVREERSQAVARYL